MNTFFVAAALLAFAVGLIHSVMGEVLIFQRLRAGEQGRGLVPTHGGPLLRERHVRILWASWHAPSVLGWGQAAALLWLAQGPRSTALLFIEHSIAASMLGASLLVLVGTRGRHPGWLGLLAVAALVWAGQTT
jgi:hypothetical protein